MELSCVPMAASNERSGKMWREHGRALRARRRRACTSVRSGEMGRADHARRAKRCVEPAWLNLQD